MRAIIESASLLVRGSELVSCVCKWLLLIPVFIYCTKNCHYNGKLFLQRVFSLNGRWTCRAILSDGRIWFRTLIKSKVMSLMLLARVGFPFLCGVPVDDLGGGAASESGCSNRQMARALVIYMSTSPTGPDEAWRSLLLSPFVPPHLHLRSLRRQHLLGPRSYRSSLLVLRFCSSVSTNLQSWHHNYPAS